MKLWEVTFFSLISVTATAQDKAIIECQDQTGVLALEAPGSIMVERQLSCGQTVTIIGLDRGYVKLQIGNRFAYVDAKYIRLQQGQSQPVAQPEEPIKDLHQQPVPAPSPVPASSTLPGSLSAQEEIPKTMTKDRDRVWKTGKVLDSQSAKTFVQTGSSTQAMATATTFSTATANTYRGTTTANGASQTQIHSMAIQETQLLIVTDEFLYVVNDSVEKGVGLGLHGALGRAIANRKHGCRVVINDPVQYSQDKSTLLVKDVDGKVCKMEIVRQERVEQPEKKL